MPEKSSILPARGAQRFAAALRRPLVVLLVLVGMVFAAYRPVLDAQFLWDDTMLVHDNLLIRSPLFVVEAFKHALFGGASNFYRPVQTLLFIADYWFWGNQPFGYHLASILIHGLNAFVLFLLLRRLLPTLTLTLTPSPGVSAPAGEENSGETPLLALLLALIWALYPIHSATVAYVAGSADSLAMLFCVLAWLGADNFLRASTTRARAAWGAAAGACLLAGFCSKEIAFVWVVLFFMHRFIFPGRDPAGLRRKLWLIGGSLLVVVIYSGLRRIPTMWIPPQSTHEISRVTTALRALGDYGSLLIYPAELLMERQVYPAPGAVLTAEDRIFFSSLTAGGVVLLAVFAAGVAWRGSGQRLRVFGVCWFMCGFLPVSNLFVRINATVAEHWLYLPSIGFLMFVAGCAWQLPTRRLRVGAIALALVAAAAFGVRTYYRAFDWMDEMTFFKQTISAGGTVPRARLSMANALSRQNRDAEAIALLRQIVEEAPTNMAAEVNLASALARQGSREEAIQVLERAVTQTATANPHELLVIVGDLDKLEGDRPEWQATRAAALAKARQQHPGSWELVQYEAIAAARGGRTAESLAEVSSYAQAHWWHYPSWFAMGCMQAQNGQPSQAITTLKQASRLDVYDTAALSAAAKESAKQGRAGEAAALLGRAVERQPESPRLRAEYAEILRAAGQTDEAGRQSARADTLLREAASSAR